MCAQMNLEKNEKIFLLFMDAWETVDHLHSKKKNHLSTDERTVDGDSININLLVLL